MSKTQLTRVVLFALFTILILGGCRNNPVYNVMDSDISTLGASNKSMDQVKSAIIDAGTPLGWVFSDKGEGHLVATLAVRKHMAVVDITYNTKAYSINYKDSENLSYDGTNIHQNYNSWVQNLQRRINIKLGSL